MNLFILTMKNTHALSGVAAAVTLALSAGAVSAEDVVQTETVHVTASRVEQELLDVPMSVSVMTSEDIERESGKTIADYLDSIPGVEVQNDGSQGLKRIQIRGESTFRTLVMIDGQKVSEHKSMSGTPILVDPSQIERIEVIKGPASVLYGSDAIGGAVNIITKKGGRKPFEGYVTGGLDTSASGKTLAGGVAGHVNGWSYRINGSVASQYREDGDEYDIKVMYAPEFRTSIADIENILIYNNQGNAVRVKDVGTVVERFAPPTIERKDRSRVNTVSAVISGVAMSEVVKEAAVEIDKIEMPAGFNIELSGTYEDQQDSFNDLFMLLILIILLVYIVMAAQFESLKYPFLIMFSIPFALSGVFIALSLTGNTLNMMSMIGIIMLIGIVVKNGIVLIDYISLNRERGMGIRQAVVHGGESRLRPVLMTTMTTILGMVPMAISHSEGAEMWRPMAVSVIGGLTISTILTLILIPVLYSSVAGSEVKSNRKKFHKKLRRRAELKAAGL